MSCAIVAFIEDQACPALQFTSLRCMARVTAATPGYPATTRTSLERSFPIAFANVTVGPAPELPQINPPRLRTMLSESRPDWRDVIDTRLSTMGLPIQLNFVAS